MPNSIDPKPKLDPKDQHIPKLNIQARKTFEAPRDPEPEGSEKPNKKYYDPRACMRSAEDQGPRNLLSRGVRVFLVFQGLGIRM